MQSLFTWFYCLPMADAATLAVLACAVFLHIHRKLGALGWWKPTLCAALALWLGVVVYATVLSREPGSYPSHNYIPFHSYLAVLRGENIELLRSNFMNVLLFLPGGLLAALLLPERFPRRGKLGLTLLLFAMLSAGIELAQFVLSLGRLEIDDVLHNTLGAILGCLLGILRLHPGHIFRIREEAYAPADQIHQK